MGLQRLVAYCIVAIRTRSEISTAKVAAGLRLDDQGLAPDTG
jgi:hypothetical protein